MRAAGLPSNSIKLRFTAKHKAELPGTGWGEVTRDVEATNQNDEVMPPTTCSRSTPRAPPNDPVAQRTPHAGLLSAVLPAQPPEEGNPEDAGTSKPRELRYPDRVKK
jgi:hypothetical protein